MLKQTQTAYNKYRDEVVKHNNANDHREMFNLEPVQEQRMEEVIRESSDFLGKISHQTVINMNGETFGLDTASGIASVTDTRLDGFERTPRDVYQVSKINQYALGQIDFDTAIRHNVLDKWRVKPEFAKLYGKLIANQIARDRIMIGWHGKSRAVQKSNITTNQMLQDVGKGWLQKIIENADNRVQDDTVVIGQGEEFKNLDALVYQLVNSAMAEHYQDDTGLVCIVGRKLLNDKYFGLINENNAATERNALTTLLSSRHVAGIPAIRPPFFPSDAILVTRLDNLAIYTQEGGTRRLMRDKPEKNRAEDFLSMNMDYVIEDYGCLAYIPTGKITIKP